MTAPNAIRHASPEGRVELEPDAVGRAFLACFGLFAGTLWVGSLFARVVAYPLIAGPRDELPGWLVLIAGWFFGPISLSIAWYANIPLLFSIGQLLIGRVPNFRFATMSVAVAATALLPVHFIDFEWGTFWCLVSGPAVWLWLASFVIAWLPSLYIRWLIRTSDE